MNRLILLAIVVLTLAEICIGDKDHDGKKSPEHTEIVKKVCCKDSKLSATQWTEFLKCHQSDWSSAHMGKNNTWAEKLKETFEKCAKAADDCEDYQTGVPEQDKFVYGMCSPKFHDCQKNEWKANHKTNSKKGAEGGHKGHHNHEGMKEKWQEHRANKTACIKTALGIA